MKKYCFVSSKKWYNNLFEKLSKRADESWMKISNPLEFNISTLNHFQPDKIFVPHWSHLIPAEIYDTYDCILFHMTDLPFGRGGSPLQNLIVRGYNETKISAIRVNKGIDSGAVYLKSDLSLVGTAKQIFERATPIIGEMIIAIIENEIIPKPQKGETIIFKRRQPENGNISKLNCLTSIYDYIRMLDCEGYPPAFIETEEIKIEFTNVSYSSKKELIANVRITKK